MKAAGIALFWVAIILLIIPTVGLAIDAYAMWSLIPQVTSRPASARMGFIILSLFSSYAPGVLCLVVAISLRRKKARRPAA
jgi:hypothetical protein